MWNEILRGNSICIYGPKGVGKSYVLQRVVKQFNGIVINYWTANNILKALLKHVGVEPVGTVEEKFLMAMKYVKNIAIGVDDYHLLQRIAKRIILKLRENNIVIVTSLRPEKGFVNIALHPSYKRCVQALASYPLREDEKQIIAEHACGLPKDAIRIARYYINKFKLREIRPGIARINLLDFETALIVALCLIFAKYLLYYKASFKEAYLVAMIAYGSLVIFHLIRKLNKWR